MGFYINCQARAELSKQSLALIGQYDLWIRKGAVSIYGAILHASSKLHRVYAPATHAIPVIKAVINPYSPYGRSAEIKIVSCKSRIRLLNEISSEYGKIWNESIEEARSPIDTTRRSFTLVFSHMNDFEFASLRILIDSNLDGRCPSTAPV